MDRSAGGYDPEVFARDISALLDALEVEGPVDLIGHDWGGWIGFMLCLRHPERMRRFLALSIYHPFIGPNFGGLIGLWRFWYQWVLATPGIGPRDGRFERFAGGHSRHHLVQALEMAGGAAQHLDRFHFGEAAGVLAV